MDPKTPADFGSIQAAQLQWRDARDRLISTWVLQLDEFSRHIRDGDRNNVYAIVFWIRLYGVIAELKKLTEVDKVALNEFSEEGKSAPRNLLNRVRLYGLLHAQVDALISKLDREDLILIDYHRNTEAHLWQSGYHVGFGEHARIPESRPIAGLNEPLTRQNVQEVLDRRITELVRAGVPHAGYALAVQIARKIENETAGLANTIRFFR